MRTDLMLADPAPAAFIWATGVEDTFIPQSRPGMRPLDEYELLGHYEHWREDLALAPAVGARAIRWGVPWYRVEPLPGQFDWSWTDQVLPYIVAELGLMPIVDLMHYGCPLWLRGEFASPDYPRAVASYAAAFARRYRHLARWYTPLNEPLINAMMCGRRGLWPPYLRGDTGYVRLMTQLALGIVQTVAALREVDPQAVMVHVEATGLSRAARPDLEPLADDDQLRRWLSLDLITGRVIPEHPLFPWLLRCGARPDDLAAMVRNPLTLDVLGLNFYPQWSTQLVTLDREGRPTYKLIEKSGAGFAELIRAYYQRYRTPVMITETSAFGGARSRARWLDESLAAVRQLRAAGLPLIGYTWFPLFTMIDWRYRYGREPAEKYRLELGLYRLADDGPRWRATPLAAQFRAHTERPEAAVGWLGGVPAPAAL